MVLTSLICLILEKLPTFGLKNTDCYDQNKSVRFAKVQVTQRFFFTVTKRTFYNYIRQS